VRRRSASYPIRRDLHFDNFTPTAKPYGHRGLKRDLYDQDTTEEVINTISVGVSIILDEESSGDAFDRDDGRLRGTKRGSQVT